MEFMPNVVQPYSCKPNPKTAHFEPYSWNGGTLLAVAGDDFAVIASDTRLSEGFSIHTRDVNKTFKLGTKTFLTCGGFHGDVLTLSKTIDVRLKMYEHEHQHEMSTSAAAAMLSTILYYRRFFPYYVYNIIGGIDDQGKGCVYSFDPVGSYQREEYRAAGSAGAILQPLLDNQLGFKNQFDPNGLPLPVRSLPLDRVVQLVKDVIISAAERDIMTGDGVRVSIVKSDGTSDTQVFPLRRD